MSTRPLHQNSTMNVSQRLYELASATGREAQTVENGILLAAKVGPHHVDVVVRACGKSADNRVLVETVAFCVSVPSEDLMSVDSLSNALMYRNGQPLTQFWACVPYPALDGDFVTFAAVSRARIELLTPQILNQAIRDVLAECEYVLVNNDSIAWAAVPDTAILGAPTGDTE